MDNWDAFVRTLRTQFGPIDPAGDAENGIDYLKMQDNQRIIKYNVEFHHPAIRTSWDKAALRHRYYTSLAERIKDIMGQQRKPVTGNVSRRNPVLARASLTIKRGSCHFNDNG